MIDDVVYWIWLQNAIGFGNNRVNDILSKVDNIFDFYGAGLDFWISLSLFSKNELIKLAEPINHFYKILEKCKSLEYSVIPIVSEQYPFMLRQISNPPLVLYTKGDCSLLKSKCVSIVGSRRATSYGIQMSYEIAHDLSKNGITIVSGGALGADSAAHRGGLSSSGGTICALACGINYPYLMQNEALREQISESGLLISEYPPSYPVKSFNFPIRNRIISGLSYCTLVVEAGHKSGSIITANIAAEQGRDVFVIPVKFESYLSEGVNELISDGARVVTSADLVMSSILNWKPNDTQKNYKPKESEKLNSRIESKKEKLNLNEDELKIFESINYEKIHIDNIVRKSKLPIKKVSYILTKLEIQGAIKSLPGKFYTKL